MKRFWDKVRRTPGCWLWRAGRFADGMSYGAFRLHGRLQKAHRVAYQIAYGSIPPHLRVLHRCDNPICVRPEHLFLGTSADNSADQVSKGRQCAGERNLGGCKLNWEIVREIRALQGLSYREIAREYSISDVMARNIRLNKNWKEIT